MKETVDEQTAQLQSLKDALRAAAENSAVPIAGSATTSKNTGRLSEIQTRVNDLQAEISALKASEDDVSEDTVQVRFLLCQVNLPDTLTCRGCRRSWHS